MQMQQRPKAHMCSFTGKQTLQQHLSEQTSKGSDQTADGMVGLILCCLHMSKVP